MSSAIQTTAGFCSDCGSILPQLSDIGDVLCYTCGKAFHPDVLGLMEIEYTIPFNTHKIRKEKQSKTSDADGPIVDRVCSKCGNTKMSYATAQLRSADEGQTCFYTCTKCKHTEAENS